VPGQGPFAVKDSTYTLLHIQVYITVVTVTLLTISMSIEAFRKAEAELQSANKVLESEKDRIEIAMSMGGIGTWEYDLASNKFLPDPNVLEVLKIDLSKYSGTIEGFLKYVHPEDHKVITNGLQTLIQRGGTFDLEYRSNPEHGNLKFFISRARLMMKDGKPHRLMGVTVDVTETKQSALRLESQRNALRNAAGMLEKFDVESENSLGHITSLAAATLNCGRAGIWKFSHDMRVLNEVDSFNAHDGSHSSGFSIKLSHSPSYMMAVYQSGVISIENTLTDQRTSGFNAE